MPRKREIQPRFPDKSTVEFDYGYRQSVLQKLIPPNKHICGYCHQQGQTEDVVHAEGCPKSQKEKAV